MSKVTVYTLKNCDTCRQAVKWLDRHGIVFEERAIRETPPATTELRAMLSALKGERRRLFNTSGKDYHELKLGEKLPAMSDPDALGLLAQNGNLVKRPFLIGSGVGLVGFDEAEWAKILGK